MTERVAAPLEVGAELTPLRLPVITRETLAAFAAVSGDRNPLHLDPDVARAAGEVDVIAHGMLSMAYAGRLLTSLSPPRRVESWRVRFVAKTPLGARPTCRGRVTDIRGEVVVLDIWVELEDGTVTTRGEARCSLVPEGNEV